MPVFKLLIPELDQAIPTARCDLAGLDRMPYRPDTHPVVRLELAVHLQDT
jgi:hypothetical protein